MLQAIKISKETGQGYTIIPLTSIVRAEYSDKPFFSALREDAISNEQFKLTILGADVQILECFVFGGESAKSLNAAFSNLKYGSPALVSISNSDLADRYLIR